MLKPPQQVQESSKPRILHTCIRLMQKDGFDAVSMRSIAVDLKMKAPSLYHHFASKESLATAAMECYREVQGERLRMLDGLDSHSDKLLGYVDMFAKMLADESRLCLCLVMLRGRDVIPPSTMIEVRKFIRQNVDWLERTIDESKAVSVSTPRALAEVVFSALEGLMLVASIDESPEHYFRSRAIDLLHATGVA